LKYSEWFVIIVMSEKIELKPLTQIDYLKVLCEKDNRDMNEVLEEQNEIIVKPNLRDFYTPHPHNAIYYPKMTYDWRDRVFAVWRVIRNLRHNNYKPFDFKSYEKTNIFSKGTPKKCTPWKRLKKFLKYQILHTIWAWRYTPPHIEHYQKNKTRIDLFEDNVKKIACEKWVDNKENEIINQFRENGYRIEPNAIWFEAVPSDKDRRLI
jgi:hypothetical protein